MYSPFNYRVLLLALLWLLFVSYLFCLPGAAFPKADWMSRVGFDKWVHIGIFTGIVYLWCWALHLTRRQSLLLLIILVLGYGLLVEVIQDRFVANRSFDWFDWLADFIGSIAGLRLWLWHKKNRPL